MKISEETRRAQYSRIARKLRKITSENPKLIKTINEIFVSDRVAYKSEGWVEISQNEQNINITNQFGLAGLDVMATRVGYSQMWYKTATLWGRSRLYMR